MRLDERIKKLFSHSSIAAQACTQFEHDNGACSAKGTFELFQVTGLVRLQANDGAFLTILDEMVKELSAVHQLPAQVLQMKQSYLEGHHLSQEELAHMAIISKYFVLEMESEIIRNEAEFAQWYFKLIDCAGRNPVTCPVLQALCSFSRAFPLEEMTVADLLERLVKYRGSL